MNIEEIRKEVEEAANEVYSKIGSDGAFMEAFDFELEQRNLTREHVILYTDYEGKQFRSGALDLVEGVLSIALYNNYDHHRGQMKRKGIKHGVYISQWGKDLEVTFFDA